MSEAFLTNTSTQGLSPLGTAPQRSFELISGTVRAQLGPRHAALFAEPVATQYGDRFDWYAAIPGKPQPLHKLTAEEKDSVQADLAGLIGDILALAQTYLDNSNPDEQRLGEALTHAVRYPDETCIYVVKADETYQPVLLNWAWASDTQVSVKADLSTTQGATRARKAATAAPMPAPPAPPASDASATGDAGDGARGRLSLWWLIWLGWLLLLLLIAAILYLMIEACALRLPGVANHCPPPGPVASESARTTALLRDQIATIERQIAIADRACQPDVQATLAPPIPDADATRLAERGAREGALTISLFWDTVADLDLHVQCPAGETINYRNKAICGGVLDLDSNFKRRLAVTDPIENIYFDAPAAGSYAISVRLFSRHGQTGDQSFRVRISQGGQVETFSGQVGDTGNLWTKTLTHGRGN